MLSSTHHLPSSLAPLPAPASAEAKKKACPHQVCFFPNLLICLINTIAATFYSSFFPMELEGQSPPAIACCEPAAEKDVFSNSRTEVTDFDSRHFRALG